MKIKPAFMLFAVWAVVAAAASPPALNDFAWRAPLQLPPDTGLARVELPAAALARMQSADARDVRVFNAAGEAVPFAWVTPPASGTNAPEERTRSYPALPLYASAPSKSRPKDSMQVHIEGRTGSVWVHTDGGDIAGALHTAPTTSDPDGAYVSIAAKQTKTRVLAVPSELVEEGTAVCGPVAEAMARGVAILLKADLAVAITGVAGPEPDEDGNPVGLVYCGVASKDGRSRHVRLDSAKREPEAINEEACHTALCLLRDFCAV